jgi:glycosyltransferase involved in cell wall biosynthesis
MTDDHGSISPSVSIVLPFRNAASTLPACLDSIHQQTFKEFEVLLVDDGSDDGSAELIRKRMNGDGRFRLLQPGRVGLVAALNHGVAHARSRLIARMDADDVMHPERLQLQNDFLSRHPDISLVSCQVDLFPRHAIRNGYREYVRWQNRCVEPEHIATNIYVESPLPHPSVMMRKSALEDVGGYQDGPFPEDYDLWLRMHAAGHRMAKVPRVLLSWRDYPERTSRVDPRYRSEAFDELRASYLGRDPRVRGTREVVVWGGGRPARLRVRRLMDKGVRVHAWLDVNPRRIGRTIWGLPVHPPEWLDQDPRPFVLVYVTSHGAREEIADALVGWGYRPGEDYLAVG